MTRGVTREGEVCELVAEGVVAFFLSMLGEERSLGEV